jgi:hypothetical protein
MKYHDNQRIVSTDPWFVTGGNPDGNGGGVIATCRSEFRAIDIKWEALVQGYRGVQVISAKDFWKEH